MSDHKNIVIYAMKEIEFLEAKIVRLETENRHLKSRLEIQTDFGNKMTELIGEMDLLLNKKKSEIESLTSQLLIPPIDSRNEVGTPYDRMPILRGCFRGGVLVTSCYVIATDHLFLPF